MLAIFTRRITFITILTLQSLQLSSVGMALSRWNSLWCENRVQIFVLAAVNTSITIANEALAREINSRFIDKSDQNAFIVSSGQSHAVNRQSLVNIWMTLITSLLGGVVFFIQKKSHRFLFFCTFGLFVSVLSQCFSHLMRDGFVYIDASRLAFDLIYLFTIKFLVFEIGRESITASFGKLRRLSGLRLLQDFTTTSIRIIALNLSGFKG